MNTPYAQWNEERARVARRQKARAIRTARAQERHEKMRQQLDRLRQVFLRVLSRPTV